jgi:hypothetical protein
MNQVHELPAATRKLPKRASGKRRTLPWTVPAKVKPICPHDRFVIALHSPKQTLGTGLPMCLPEKILDIDAVQR